MDRELNKFRTKARIVAFLDLILSSMVLCFWLFVFIGLMSMSSRYNSGEGGRVGGSSFNGIDLHNRMEGSGGYVKGVNFGQGDNFIGPNKTFLNLMWGLLGLFAFGTAVQIVAAVKLLNATQLGKEPLGAMRLVRTWRIVCIIFTALWVFNFFSSFRQRGDNFFETSFILTNILIRMSALYVVQQYYNELVGSVSTGSLPMHHQPTVPAYPSSVNMAYMYGPQFPPMPSQSMAPPPKYEDVFKDPLANQENNKTEPPVPPPTTTTTTTTT